MATPSIAMIPSAYKAGKLYSVLPTNGNGDLDVARASSATRVNQDGLIELMANNVPRLDYSDGSCPSLLLEPQSTNLITYSEDFSNVAWTKTNATQTASQGVSPDGTNTATLITNTGTNGYFQDTINFTANLEYTASAFLKSGTSDVFTMVYTPFMSEDIQVEFNLSTQTVTNLIGVPVNSGIEDFGNGWYRCFITETKNAATNASFFRISLSGASGVTGYIWGAQLEQQSSATSYIPTTGATVTRLQDEVSKTGISSLINSSEGVLYAEISALANDGTDRALSLSDGTTSNRVSFRYSSNNIVRALVAVGGSLVFDTTNTITVPDITEKIKICLKYKENDFALWINGVEVSTDNTGSIFSASTLDELIFTDGASGSTFFGNCKNIRVYTTALTDEELATLTT